MRIFTFKGLLLTTVQILRGAEDRLAVFVADRQIAAHDLLDRPKRKA